MPAPATQGRLSALFDALTDFRASSPTAVAQGQLEVYLIIESDYPDTFKVQEYTFSPTTMLNVKTEQRKPNINEARSTTTYTIQRQGKRISAYVGDEDRPMYGLELRRMIETLKNPQSPPY